MFALPKFNIAPENRESQKETHLPTIHFQGRAVKLPGGNDFQVLNLDEKGGGEENSSLIESPPG